MLYLVGLRVVSEIFNVEKCCDLEIVSKAFNVIESGMTVYDRLCTVSY